MCIFVGVNVTVIVQLAPAATLEPQLLVCEKLALTEIFVIVSVALPMLVSVMLCGVLLVPTN